MPHDLSRFLKAQSEIYDRARQELMEGRKQTHWMWFIFPQIAGLGHSPTARHYAIADIDEAKAYLRDEVLGQRLRECVKLSLTHRRMTARQIFGTPDDLKFRSCLTLFLQAADSFQDKHLFEQALRQFYDGAPDENTLQRLSRRQAQDLSP